MKVLVIGSGGREHALCWKISQSSKVTQLFCCPGNAGTAEVAENIPISASNIEDLRDFALEQQIDLTVIGPEDPLVQGLADEFERSNLKVFGPKKKAAILEGSKVFSKEFMKRHNIPTAAFEVFDNAEKAMEYVKVHGAPIVVKADGLAAGKGVVLCKTEYDAEQAIRSIMEDKQFGKAGDKIVLEDLLVGEEASILAFVDGENVQLMVSSQDHKRALDNDEGLNTGGMGAYSPAPVVTEDLREKILKEVIEPTVKGMKEEGREYKGVLYAGLMIKDNELNVLEFNVRFGDPETQVVLPRLRSDIIEPLLACANGNLNEITLDWDTQACTCVVLASGGYPLKYEKGLPIYGLEEAKKLNNTVVFHAGTAYQENQVVTNGGRVLGVTALGPSIKESIENTYNAVNMLSFDKMHLRKDIGFRALNR
jgi:phosphoribosylamine--glycine ligase